MIVWVKPGLAIAINRPKECGSGLDTAQLLLPISASVLQVFLYIRVHINTGHKDSTIESTTSVLIAVCP